MNQAMTSGSWSVNTDHLRFSIDLSGSTLSLADGIALHWGPTCGNDIIEGFAVLFTNVRDQSLG